MIDRWIGRVGQDKVRGWLETWWYKFSYVKLRSFGLDEVQLFLKTFDFFAGRKFLSLRRAKVVIKCGLLSIAIGMLPQCLYNGNNIICLPDWNAEIGLAITVIALSASLSLTRAFAIFGSRLMVRFPRANVMIFVGFLVFQYLVFCLWTPILSAIIGIFDISMGEDVIPIIGWVDHLLVECGVIPISAHIIRYHANIFSFTYQAERFYYNAVLQFFPPPKPFQNAPPLPSKSLLPMANTVTYFFPSWVRTEYILSLLPYLFRCVFAGLFVLSYLLVPLQETILEMWGEVLESKKPFFFPLLAGTAAIYQVVANFWRLL